ncbi:euchromatic histone lysine N-methyltransferase 2, isoform CRA_d [Rattus norvegicus]|uniref:Euchromatic histone lysine N-methyltransferase 2, isoform CRA_d n=1 Tax=Rattus norvegicus TaxID=10116 RepID=A6KTN4_RAT|nr:euchromatic histone lysine N-methyltransferase 2, isoform CRA_d [Rattus norvegicus]
MVRSTALMPVTMATSAASLTTCATPTSSLFGSSCCIKTYGSLASPSSAPGTSGPGRSWGLTTATGSGISRASISPASVALRSASIQLRPSPWSRAAWPVWTPTRSCSLTSAPCPPSTPEDC